MSLRTVSSNQSELVGQGAELLRRLLVLGMAALPLLRVSEMHRPYRWRIAFEEREMKYFGGYRAVDKDTP